VTESEPSGKVPAFRLSLEEAAGSIGNFGTVLPIVLGVALVSDVNLGQILLFFGIWYILTGVIYRIPVPVEPMKAMGAIVIAEGLLYSEIVTAGVLIGVFTLLIGVFGGMRFMRDRIPEYVIRGIQLGLALVLLKTATPFILKDPFFAFLGIGIIVIFLLAGTRWQIPNLAALVVILIGIGAAITSAGVPEAHMIEPLRLTLPSFSTIPAATWHLVIPQIPLVLTNATLATALLAHDLYKKNIEPDKLAITIGAMNLVSVPLGGFPMCHGAGGLAAHYRFGARTGMGNVIGGIILIGAALFFASPAAIQSIPQGVFAALLVFVSIELAKNALKTDSMAITAIMGAVAVLSSMTIAFFAGLAIAWIYHISTSRSGNRGST
jgi:MFS superfamily sulfate permease-like transporter